jgi:hypothetical protein
VPGAAPAKGNNKTLMWVLIGCGGCSLVSVAALAIGAVFFGAFAARQMTDVEPAVYSTSAGMEGSSSSAAVAGPKWTVSAKDCKETCQHLVACEKAEYDESDVESQSDCEKDCGPKLDGDFTCMSKALNCDDLLACEEEGD